MLANAKSVHKIETIRKGALRSMLNDYESSSEDLVKNSGKPSMNLRRTRSLCIEIYKTINNFMKSLFKVHKTNRAQREQYKLNLEITKFSQVSFHNKSLRIQYSRVLNVLPSHIKSKTTFRFLKM